MSAIIPTPGWFGAGQREPWTRALGSAGTDLWLVAEAPGAVPERLDVARWNAPADDADRAALVGVSGAVLDVGCGPGRMVRAALDAGLPTLGIDVERAAVVRCRSAGLPVLHRSVFAGLPHEGGWGTILLLDGNIGIGGDPVALLTRCRELLAPQGGVVVEVDPRPARDDTATCRVTGPDGASGPFRWSWIGEHALLIAAWADYAPEQAWSAAGRRFVRLRAV